MYNSPQSLKLIIISITMNIGQKTEKETNRKVKSISSKHDIQKCGVRVKITERST